MDFLIHWPPGPVVATVQCQGLGLCESGANVRCEASDCMHFIVHGLVNCLKILFST